MGDIGSALSGGFNSIASVYNNERNIEMQQETNALNYRIHNEDNAFNDWQGEKSYKRQLELQSNEQNFNAEQAGLNRTFQSEEAQKGRDWQEQMYNQYQSPEALAGQYQRLGISPAAVMNGAGGTMVSTSLPSGSQASDSSGSAPQVSSSSPASMVAPQVGSNPISDFIAAFQSSQRTQAEVNKTQLENEWQKTQNQFAVREKIMELKFKQSQIDSELSKKDLTDEQRSTLEVQKHQYQLQLEVAQSSLDDLKAMSALERREKEEKIKNIVLQNTQQEMVNSVTPKLLSSKINLNNSQASAAIKAADAAMSQAMTAKYNAETHRLEYRLDESKWYDTFKSQVEAQTKMYENISDNQDVQAQRTQKDVDWYEADKIIQIAEFLLHEQTQRVGVLLNAFGGVLK